MAKHRFNGMGGGMGNMSSMIKQAQKMQAEMEKSQEELSQKEFVSWHAVDNPASGAVMRKCGFVYEKNEIHTKFDGVTSFDTRKHRLIIQ